MLSILKTLTKNGRRAIYKSSVWLAIFQIVAMLPLILIYQTISKIKYIKINKKNFYIIYYISPESPVDYVA